MSDRFVVWLSTSPVATWWIRHVASRLDPILFRATNGRLTSFGPPAMPMLTLTTAGRRSGRPQHPRDPPAKDPRGGAHVKKYRVIQWATGVVGSAALRGVRRHPRLELVGVKVYGEAKEGRDAGAILALDADCLPDCRFRGTRARSAGCSSRASTS